MLAVEVPALATTSLRNDCRRQAETMLALCVACEVLWAPENLRAVVV